MLMMAFRSLALAAALGQLCGLASAQLNSNLGFTSACPFSGLSSRVDQLNAACCVPAGDGSGGECAGTCTADCIGTLYPLMEDCRDVVNSVFDGADGVEDGVSSAVSSIEDDCNQVEPENLVDMLMTLQAEGKCPPTVLDGIGETAVADEACANVWTGGRCEMSIASGVFTCAADFCDTCDTPGQCDNSCKFCADHDGAGHRRRRAMLEEFRRKMQMGKVQCDPASFAAQVAAVEDACCDADGSACTDGAPVQCDAKCAVVFNNFYSRCQRFMAAQFSPAEMGGYDRLYTTCTASLPAQPLLRALVVCSNFQLPVHILELPATCEGAGLLPINDADECWQAIAAANAALGKTTYGELREHSYSFRAAGCQTECYSDAAGYFCAALNSNADGRTVAVGEEDDPDDHLFCRE